MEGRRPQREVKRPRPWVALKSPLERPEADFLSFPLISSGFGGIKLIIHKELGDVCVNTDSALGPGAGFHRRRLCLSFPDSETTPWPRPRQQGPPVAASEPSFGAQPQHDRHKRGFF